MAYARRALPPHRSGAVQEHLARCGECAALVLDFAGFDALKPPTPAHRISIRELRQRRRALTHLLAKVHAAGPQ